MSRKEIIGGIGQSVSIGDVTIPLRTASNPQLVPINYVGEASDLPQHVLHHLRWMAQKDLLGQDMFLIGPPGPFRRTLAMQYLELVNREMEYVCLSRDTTETDLKQRREITSGTAYYVDQCAVNAATNGRVLVIDGIEKAERNVLPVINNLLENREMQLEDGRFLMAAIRYDKLLQSHSKQQLDDWKLVRVSEDFRVIAIGLPVPRYQGHPLDPPLRSRFQGRDVGRLPFHEFSQLLKERTSVPEEEIVKMLSFAFMFVSKEAEELGLPDFPLDALMPAMKLLESIPGIPLLEIINRLYPYSVFTTKDNRTSVEDALKNFRLHEGSSTSNNNPFEEAAATSYYKFGAVDSPETSIPDQVFANVTLCSPTDKINLKLNAGKRIKELIVEGSGDFVSTDAHQDMLSQMLQSHLIGDFCIIGPKGSGKSTIVKQFAKILSYDVEPFVLYKDITSRELLQQRSTLENGDTVWRSSPLVNAALEGKLLVLDGIHRVDGGTLAVLHRFCNDREVNLFDGTRLLSHTKYDQIKTKHGLGDQKMLTCGIKRIHPSFRLIALAEPPEASGGSGKRWLDAELISLFRYHHLRPLKLQEESYILKQLGVKVCEKVVKLLDITHELRNSLDPALNSLAGSLSTRQLIRLSRRISTYEDESVQNLIQNACLSRFLPTLTKEAFDALLCKYDKVSQNADNSFVKFDSQSDVAISCEVKNGIVRIGSTSVPLHSAKLPSKVPDIIFYDVPQHLSAMESMLKDFLLGEHLLLIGNQGVGKNKIVDRFLQLLNRPREYIQLHRDTTIQTLTLQPTVQNGTIVYEDSPLVQALKLGHVLVVDEADKAPAHVVCILKTLLDSGEMLLSDGRRVVLPSFAQEIPESKKEKYVIMHPDFRLIVLANRPGFPFLGNDFYRALGDIFACHPIDNPDFKSEMTMLKQYGPDVPENLLIKLTRAFGELRTIADSGLLSYPYSIREAVNIVRHIQKFPDDSLASVIRNIFDFDSYGKETVETLQKVLKKHGIPFGLVIPEVDLSIEYELPDAKLDGRWINLGKSLEFKDTVFTERPLQVKGPIAVSGISTTLERLDHRSSKFSEIQSSWKLPMHYTNIVSDVAVSKDNSSEPLDNVRVNIVTSNPVHLYTFNLASSSITCYNLGNFFPATKRGTFKPRIHIASLGESGDLFLFDEMSGTKLTFHPTKGSVCKIEEPGIFNTAEGFMQRIAGQQPAFYSFCPHMAKDQLLFTYQEYGDEIEYFDLKSQTYSNLHLPMNISAAYPLSKQAVLLISEDQKKFLLNKTCENNNTNATIYTISDVNSSVTFGDIVPDALDAKISLNCPESIMSTSGAFPMDRMDTYATLALGLSDNFKTVDILGYARDRSTKTVQKDGKMPDGFSSAFSVIPSDGTFIRAHTSLQLPLEINPKGIDVNFLEIVDLINNLVRYIPVEKPTVVSPYATWLSTRQDSGMVISPVDNGRVVVVDISGAIHLYEIGSAQLQHSLKEWKRMLGDAEQRHLQVTINQKSSKPISSPKFGKIDSKNAPHVGGNTWAGGTGGRDTAGLGGMGGPFRLDAGHDVFQVSDLDKAAVPEEVLRAAREMARKAHQERLREIKMSKYDADEYEKISASIRPQVKLIRVLLDSLHAKANERQWLHHKNTGEIDDIKIVEGLTGEHNVFKLRGEQEPEVGSPQELPKRLKLLVDVSGSMYRFNGYDGRLERMLEAALIVMESFEKYEHKFKYEIIGHSGDDYDVSFVNEKNIPQNNKERMDVLKNMHAHAQFCSSGDNTLEATKHAIKTIVKDKADEYFVIVLSDANFDRYGIPADYFAKLLTSEPRVNSFALFIGSLGDQAQRLKEDLPPGHAFVCLNTDEIPGALRQIFTSSIVNTNNSSN